MCMLSTMAGIRAFGYFLISVIYSFEKYLLDVFYVSGTEDTVRGCAKALRNIGIRLALPRGWQE